VITRKAVTATRQLMRFAHPPTDSRSAMPHYNPSNGSASCGAVAAVAREPKADEVGRTAHYPTARPAPAAGQRTTAEKDAAAAVARSGSDTRLNIGHRPYHGQRPRYATAAQSTDRYLRAGEPPHRNPPKSRRLDRSR
jgi:hypothetical protein